MYLLGLPLSAHELRVGVYSNSPKIFLDAGGNPAGIVIDVLEYAAQEEGWELMYVPGEWAVLLEALAEGRIDILPDIAYSEDRAKQIQFSQINVIDDWLQVYTLPDNPVHLLADLEGASIAVLQGSMQEDYLSSSFRETFGIQFSLHSHADYFATAQAVLHGTADVLVASRFFSFSPERDPRIVPSSIVFRPAVTLFGFRPDIPADIPAVLDAHITVLHNDPDSVYYRALDVWFSRPHSLLSQILLSLLIVSIVVLLFLAVFIPVLRLQVRRRNAELIIANRNLRISLEEREKLLRELYHRTRNNMQIMCGILSLQAAHHESEELHAAFESAQNRIQAMAIVHESLLEGEDLHCLLMQDFIHGIVEMVRASTIHSSGEVRVSIKVPDIVVSMENALALGMILNELLSNSFRHAFTTIGSPLIPEIGIQMDEHPAADGRYSIVYEDNGSGIQNVEMFMQPESLGLQLVHSIAESQLGAHVLFEKRQGLYCRMEYIDMQRPGCADQDN